MEGLLDSIEFQTLKRVDYLPTQKPPNISTDSVMYSSFECGLSKMSHSLVESTLLSIPNSMESKTPFNHKYSVVL